MNLKQKATIYLLLLSSLCTLAFTSFANASDKTLRPENFSAAQNDNQTHGRKRRTRARTHAKAEASKVKASAQNKSAPARAKAQCRDGSYSFIPRGKGTCSHHRGVAKWL